MAASTNEPRQRYERSGAWHDERTVMHLDLTDDQAEAVQDTLAWSQRRLASYLKSGRAQANPAKSEWARERMGHIEIVLSLFPEITR